MSKIVHHNWGCTLSSIVFPLKSPEKITKNEITIEQIIIIISVSTESVPTNDLI